MAFSSNQRAEIREGMLVLKGRVLNHNPLHLEMDEPLQLFAPPEHREILRRAPGLADLSYRGTTSITVLWSWGNLHFHMLNEEAPLPPKDPRLQDDAPPELVHRISEWVKWRVQVEQDFGRLWCLFVVLDELCWTKNQIRFFFPSILPVLRQHDAQGELADKLSSLTNPRDLPTIDLSVKDACQKASGTVASALLIDGDRRSPRCPKDMWWAHLNVDHIFDEYDTDSKMGYYGPLT